MNSNHSVLYLIFIIHSSTEGRLGCFYFLAIVKRIPVNRAEPVSVKLDVESCGHMQRSGILGHIVDLVLAF